MSRKRLIIIVLVAGIILAAGLFSIFIKKVSRNSTDTLSDAPKASQVEDKPKSTSSCIFTDENHCSEYKTARYREGENSLNGLGINLPEGTPIYSPIDGQLFISTTLEESTVTEGTYIAISDKNDSKKILRIIGDFRSEKAAITDVSKGELIGVVGDNGVENFGYNVVIFPTVDDGQGKVIDDEDLVKMILQE